MSSSLNWKFSYRPEEGSRRGRESNKKMSDRHETSRKPDWPFGYTSKPPHSSSSKEESVASKSNNKGGATPRKKEDWEIQAISAAASRRSGSGRETASSPKPSRHGEHGAAEKRGRHAGRSTERVIPGTYPHETASAHHKSADFDTASWEQKPETSSETSCAPDIPVSSSWNYPPMEVIHVHSSDHHIDNDTTNSHHSRAVSPEKQRHSSKASSKASSTKSFTPPDSRTPPRHSSPTHSPPPSHHGPTTGSVPLDLALRDMHQALSTAHTLFASYESAYDLIAGHIVKIAEDNVLDRLWQQMVRDRFSREPDRREFEAARDALRSRTKAVESAAVGEDNDGYSLERRRRAARKVVAHMAEIMPLVSRARKERMGCKFLVEEVSELMAMLDPKVHVGLYSAGEERRWIGSVKAVGKGKELKGEEKNVNNTGGRAQSRSKTSDKEQKGKQAEVADGKDGSLAADAGKQNDDSGNNQQKDKGTAEEQKKEDNDISWDNDQQTGNDNDQDESGSQKGNWTGEDGSWGAEGNDDAAAREQEAKESCSNW